MEQKILLKIISDAESKAEEIIASATRKAEADVEEARALLENERSERISALKSRGEEQLRRTEINARLDSNRLLLSARRQVLDGVFSLALEKLCSLSQEEYSAFIGSLIEKYADEGDGLVLSTRCGCKEAIKNLDIVKNLRLEILPSSDGFVGGAVLIGKGCDKNLTFEALIQSAKDEKQAEIASRIFG